MKTSLTKLSSSFLLLTFSLAVFAKPVAQVTSLTGSAFVITPDGKSGQLHLNQHLDEKSEVMVEEGASITLNDYYDATYNLTGGSHLKFYDKSVQLKKGKAWIQSMNAHHPLALTTANGNIDFSKSEFITTFDQLTSKTQVLVVNGEVEVANILDRNMKYSVTAGMFTMVDPDVENGVPRTPTKIGLQSLNVALAEFKQLPEKATVAIPSREVASVEKTAEKSMEKPVPKRGEILFIKNSRLPASVSGSALNYFESKTTKVKKMKKVSYKTVPIRVYGTNFNPVKPYEAPVEIPRQPASIQPSQVIVPQKAAVPADTDKEFAESLKMHSVEQPKHSKELDSLIQDLKSF